MHVLHGPRGDREAEDMVLPFQTPSLRTTLGWQGRWDHLCPPCSLLLAGLETAAQGGAGQGLLQVLGDGGGEGCVPVKGTVPAADAGDTLEGREAERSLSAAESPGCW